MITLGAILQTGPQGEMIKNLAPFARGSHFTTNEHGFALYETELDVAFIESFRLYDRTGLPHISVGYLGCTAWAGRVEDPTLHNNGNRLRALGYSRGYTDVPYTATHTNVTAQSIVNAIIANVSSRNSFMSSSTALVQDPGVTLNSEIYEDVYPDQILNRLIQLGDDATTPRLWEWGVCEDQRLYYRPRGDAGRSWYTDVSRLQLDRTLETLWNSVYATYQGAAGQRILTATASDLFSQQRYGVVREIAIQAHTTSTTTPENIRDAFLDDRSIPSVRAQIDIPVLYDVNGVMYPKWAARSGDNITIRNIPPTASIEIDLVRRFMLKETDYLIDSDTLKAVPEFMLPTLTGVA
jgi:hypothetical protein